MLDFCAKSRKTSVAFEKLLHLFFPQWKYAAFFEETERLLFSNNLTFSQFLVSLEDK